MNHARPKTNMASTGNTQPFQDFPCSVVVGNNYDTYGTITRASIASLTPAQLVTLFKPGGLFADMDAWFQTSFEMQTCGIKRNGLYDWLMSSAKDVKSLLTTQKLDRGPSLLFPFIMGRQMSVINNDYFALSNGWAQSAYTATVTGPLTTADLANGTATDRIIRVITRYGIDLNAGWFQAPHDKIHIFSRSGGVTQNGAWRVLAAEVDPVNLAYVDVLIRDENSGSSVPYSSTPGAAGATAVVVRGGNNVSDYESYCQNRPTLDPRKRVPFWFKTSRRVRQIDSEYELFYERMIKANEYFREFGDLPMAERNRQDEENYQRQWCIDFFFGKRISSNQSLANYQQLEQINTYNDAVLNPGLGGKLIGYRAEPEGVLEQLRECGQVVDLQNNALNLYDFLQAIYNVVRARKSMGKVADSIDCYMDSVTAANMETAFMNYYIKEYGGIARLNVDTAAKTNEFGFVWTSYKVKFPAGVTINLITHEFFDDIVNAGATEGIDSATRMILILDIGKPGPRGGTIYPGMITTKRVQRTVGDIENLAKIDPGFACVLEYPTNKISLTSETFTVVVECPAASLILTGVANAVPTTTGLSVSYPVYELYGP
jgi:hypothetical protein